MPICYDHLRNHPFFTLATSDKGELDDGTSSSSSSSFSRASPGLLSASASSANVAPPVPAVGVAHSGSNGSGGLAFVSETSPLGPAVRIPLLSELCVNACGRACMVVAEAVAQVCGCDMRMFGGWVGRSVVWVIF